MADSVAEGRAIRTQIMMFRTPEIARACCDFYSRGPQIIGHGQYLLTVVYPDRSLHRELFGDLAEAKAAEQGYRNGR